MALLMFISIGIYRITIQTFKLREDLREEGDFYTGIQLAMRVINQDITMFYTPIVVLPKKDPKKPGPTTDELKNQLPPEKSDSSDFWNPAVHATGIRPSHFYGTEEKLSFVTASHLRIYREKPESVFAKVKFELNDNDKTKDGTKILVKKFSTDAFSNDDELKRTYPLLHGVKSIKFQYYNKYKDRWEKSWDSANTDFKDIYPDLVELTIEVVEKTRTFEGKFEFRPELPIYGIPKTL